MSCCFVSNSMPTMGALLPKRKSILEWLYCLRFYYFTRGLQISHQVSIFLPPTVNRIPVLDSWVDFDTYLSINERISFTMYYVRKCCSSYKSQDVHIAPYRYIAIASTYQMQSWHCIIGSIIILLVYLSPTLHAQGVDNNIGNGAIEIQIIFPRINRGSIMYMHSRLNKKQSLPKFIYISQL